ncbi:hypothetical protein PQ478_19670 [Alkalihalophilus pseudofirmus]|uniref:hypothetical protein n=1 Tax=Alkalihalophilus pseudofirmus TaxID=79885 RepID=UPI00259B9FEB|nr:hypothetical protein [Alkalihalophilus pseudofirmus]WEG16698.1 hypothetical protein PQ478_19670 [Alkalihalophilus pseudofirmus]
MRAKLRANSFQTVLDQPLKMYESLITFTGVSSEKVQNIDYTHNVISFVLSKLNITINHTTMSKYENIWKLDFFLNSSRISVELYQDYHLVLINILDIDQKLNADLLSGQLGELYMPDHIDIRSVSRGTN